MKSFLTHRPRLKSFLLVVAVLATYSCIGCLLLKFTTNGSTQGAVLLHRQIRSLLISVAVSAGIFAMPRKAVRPVMLIGGCITYLSLWGLFCFGVRLNGCFGWYKFGSLCIQPAEILKPFFIMALTECCMRTSSLTNPHHKLLLLLAFIAAILLPITLQPDLGTAFILAVTFIIVTWCNGMPNRHLLILSLIGLAAVTMAYWHYPHLRNRVKNYAENVLAPNQMKGYHARRLQECLVKGGWTGNLLQQQEALHPLPYRYSDSLFAGTVEMIGACGAIPIVLLYLAWQFYAYKQTLATDNHHLKLVYIGTGSLITTQAMLHIAVNLGLFPNTGIPLPLLSYGGSSLLATFMAVSIAQRLHVEHSAARHDPLRGHR